MEYSYVICKNRHLKVLFWGKNCHLRNIYYLCK